MTKEWANRRGPSNLPAAVMVLKAHFGEALMRSWPISWVDPALGVAARSQARRAYRRLLRAAGDSVRIQEKVLLNRISDNADSDFGRKHAFSRIRRYNDYRSTVPIRDYEQYRPFIQQVMEGNESALFGSSNRVLMFAMTSGSTNLPKYIPITTQFIRDYRNGWNAFGGKALLDHPEAFMRPILQVTSPLDVERTARGVPCGSISGLLAREQSFIVRRYYAAPPEVAQIRESEARHYAIMRFALPRDVAWIVTASPATPLQLARTADSHAEALIRDIHDGTLSPPTPLPKLLKDKFLAKLKPAPQAAARLESLLSRSGALLPKDYWRLAFLANWTGGTLALHLRDFPHYFGDTPVREIGLLATEGRMSIGLNSATPVSLMDTASGFFEFAEANDGTGHVKRCHELDVGGVYRVIMTTAAGLYRYDIGDCVRIVGYEGRTPLIEFLHRGSRVSSITGEKLTEWQVTQALERIHKKQNAPVCKFVVCPTWGNPPYYSLFTESSPIHRSVIAAEIDAELASLNMEYAAKRSSHRLGPLCVVELPEGTFARWYRHCMEIRNSGDQFKHQYLLTAPGQDEELRRYSEHWTGPHQGQRAGTA